MEGVIAAKEGAEAGRGGDGGSTVDVRYTRLADAVSLNKTVGAVRISVGGWEGAVIEGGMGLFSHETNSPSIILVEMNHRASLEAGMSSPVEVLFRLYNLGYVKISHAGPICRRRWKKQRGLFNKILRMISSFGKCHSSCQHALFTILKADCYTRG